MINKERFDAWRSSPATKEVLQFLKEFQADMAMRWARGETMPDDAQYVAKAYGELAELEHADIEKFYAVEEQESELDAEESRSA